MSPGDLMTHRAPVLPEPHQGEDHTRSKLGCREGHPSFATNTEKARKRVGDLCNTQAERNQQHARTKAPKHSRSPTLEFLNDSIFPRTSHVRLQGLRCLQPGTRPMSCSHPSGLMRLARAASDNHSHGLDNVTLYLKERQLLSLSGPNTKLSCVRGVGSFLWPERGLVGKTFRTHNASVFTVFDHQEAMHLKSEYLGGIGEAGRQGSWAGI